MVNSRYILGRRPPRVQTCRTFSGYRSRVLQAARMPQSARRPCAPTRTRYFLGHVANYARTPSVSPTQKNRRRYGWDAHSGEMHELLGEEGQPYRDGCFGKPGPFVRMCRLVVDPYGRSGPRAREPKNRDPRENCVTSSVRLGPGAIW